MNFEVALDNLEDGAIIALLTAHRQEMHKYSPPESIHALDPATLKGDAINFWGARYRGELAGCGALKALSPQEGELKSMKTAAAFLRKGVATLLLNTIMAQAKQRGYTKIYLETGRHKAFQPATALYTRYGFTECGPFADYSLDPHSQFFCKHL